jgi:peroxiredoxin Q/BCP
MSDAKLKIGSKAPDFCLPDQAGTPFRLSEQQGQPVVLYFYPRDDTSGCTAQAKDFSCLAGEFAAAGAVVVGVSPDSVASHDKFRTKHDLAVRLLADEDKAVAEAYGVWVEKSMYGRRYMGVERSTFLLDATGRIRAIWSKVKVPNHGQDVLDVARTLA